MKNLDKLIKLVEGEPDRFKIRYTYEYFRMYDDDPLYLGSDELDELLSLDELKYLIRNNYLGSDVFDIAYKVIDELKANSLVTNVNSTATLKCKSIEFFDTEEEDTILIVYDINASTIYIENKNYYLN